MKPTYKYEYILSDGVKLFTAVLLPDNNGKYPSVVMRSPYVDALENMSEEEICERYLSEYSRFLEYGYAVVFQHCRGRGKSYGDCIPYINEHKDTNNLYNWIRGQEFYNKELFLFGGSYTTSVHHCAYPYDSDIKGAVFGMQDTERYNIFYRNGFFKKALGGEWYVGMYKAKSKIEKNYNESSFEMLPLKNFTKEVFGKNVPTLDGIISSPKPTDAFWKSHEGGSDTRNITDNLPFPVLFTTGFYDIYTGGLFDMWKKMNPATRENCSLVVSPNDHGDHYDEQNGIYFENGKRAEYFGKDYEIEWFEAIRNGTDFPFEKGQVTYYRLFESSWKADFFEHKKEIEIPLGSKAFSYIYNPDDPPAFKGGLSCNFGGGVYENDPYLRQDIITVYTEPFETDTFVKGKMKCILSASSDCYDTCFYVRISITKKDGDFGLRDDITSLCYQLGDYKPCSLVNLSFTFDEHAFLIKKGERLRIDIASASGEHYVRHTNNKGLYSEQLSTRVAKNTVYLQNSRIILPIE